MGDLEALRDLLVRAKEESVKVQAERDQVRALVNQETGEGGGALHACGQREIR